MLDLRRLSSVFLSNTNHEEDQLIHFKERTWSRRSASRTRRNGRPYEQRRKNGREISLGAALCAAYGHTFP
ncbi:4Fe-4S dicluster domain-containing protein [Tianweitania sp. Rool2]|uniref:4Fe-4S dicluster domain-containing protein n=1 Tax=Oryzicola mucosus TaxID=2767425 RepID=A0A8J6U1V0_9HYPH|nr:4Fe-4S dicluster domain-containing protein [Oryzicola mucosus]